MEHLRNYPFRDPRRARSEMLALHSSLGHEAGTHLDLLLASSPAPQQALHYFVSLRERQPAAVRRLTVSTHDFISPGRSNTARPALRTTSAISRWATWAAGS